MKTILLNGGNFGGVSMDIPDDKSVVAIQSSATDFWVYDNTVHTKTATADFVGMVEANDPVLSAPTTHQVDFQGV